MLGPNSPIKVIAVVEKVSLHVGDILIYEDTEETWWLRG